MLDIENLEHAYGASTVLRGLSLHIPAGEVGCLLGPSGCGKTTALRLIAGFEAPRAGRIRIGGLPVADARPGQEPTLVPPEQRFIGLVFQDYALFPHLSVEDNVGFGLRRWAQGDHQRRVEEMLALTGLDAVRRQRPTELSGGQQQRVALARALAPRPRLLLLDEPFSNLDVELRERLSLDVRELLRHENITALLVTHDQHEAFAMADRIGVMHEGRLVQWGSAYDLYHRPASRFVADFIGQGVFLPGEVLSADAVQIELGVLRGVDVAQCDGGSCLALGRGAAFDVLLRPDDITHDDASPIQAEVVRRAFRGAEFLYTLRLDSGRQVLCLVPSHHNHAIGERIGIRLAVDHVIAFARPD
jgi:iron(III) transport system ATP-binding protein